MFEKNHLLEDDENNVMLFYHQIVIMSIFFESMYQIEKYFCQHTEENNGTNWKPKKCSENCKQRKKFRIIDFGKAIKLFNFMIIALISILNR